MMVAHNRISQAENVSQYLMHAKDYLEHINHTSKLSSIDSSGLNHISLVQDLRNNYVRQRVSKEAENWKTMADAFDSIAKRARMAGKTKAYNKPRYEKSTDIHAISHYTNNSQRGFLVHTRALTEAPMATIGTAVTAILSRLQGTIHPGRAAIKNWYVITAWVHIT